MNSKILNITQLSFYIFRGLGISLSVTLGRMMIIVSNTLIDHLIYKFCFIVWNSYAALIFCEYIQYNYHINS